MNHKKLFKLLGRIVLIILITWTVDGMVKLFQGEGAIIDVIGPICIMVLVYIIPTDVWNQKPKP